MIEREMTLIMRCDKCGDVLVDDFVKCIIRLPDDRSAYAQLRQRATELCWKCDECCLCPYCRKDVEDE